MRVEWRGARARRGVGRTAPVIALAALAIAAAACAPATSTPPVTTTPGSTTTLPGPVAGATPPVISGTPRAGSSLTTTIGTWTGDPTSFSIQWQSCAAADPTSCRDVGTGTATYVVADTEVGRTIRTKVTASDDATTATQFATAVGPVLPSLPIGTGRAGIWSATGTRRLCALLGSTWTCGAPTNVTLKFTLGGECNGTAWCRLSEMSGPWGWSPSGGSVCMTPLGTDYQAVSGTVTATFTLNSDFSIAVQAVVPQNPFPLTANVTDARATRIGDLTSEPLPCP